MTMDILTENVTSTVITPFVQLKLLPTGVASWGLDTNNNWIKTDNAMQSLEEEVKVARQAIDDVGANLDAQITVIRSTVENETILRSAADADLQAQVDIRAMPVRFSHRPLTAGDASMFTHNLAVFPQVSVIREIGGGGIDVTNDTVIQHSDVNNTYITVSVSGTYTIVCVG